VTDDLATGTTNRMAAIHPQRASSAKLKVRWAPLDPCLAAKEKESEIA
jgi:hypothetical protein